MRVVGLIVNRRRTYEILQEHIPEKADWDYVKAWEADIPRRHGDQVPCLLCYSRGVDSRRSHYRAQST